MGGVDHADAVPVMTSCHSGDFLPPRLLLSSREWSFSASSLAKRVFGSTGGLGEGPPRAGQIAGQAELHRIARLTIADLVAEHFRASHPRSFARCCGDVCSPPSPLGGAPSRKAGPKDSRVSPWRRQNARAARAPLANASGNAAPGGHALWSSRVPQPAGPVRPPTDGRSENHACRTRWRRGMHGGRTTRA